MSSIVVQPNWTQRAAVVRAIATYGRNPISAYALEPDKLAFTGEASGAIAYRACAGVALAAGEPMAAEGHHLDLATAFIRYCRQHGWIPAFYQTLDKDIDAYRSVGLRALKIGEEAIIDLPSFTLVGKRIANVRHCVSHVERAGLHAEIYADGVADTATLDGLDAVSAAWLQARSGRGEMGFSMGGYARAAMRSTCVVLARDNEGLVRAFVTFRYVDGGKGVVLDLMRRDSSAPSGVIDFIIARALERFRDAGLSFASLSLAPLANVQGDGRAPRVERLLGLLYDKGNAAYRYKSLYAFKKKFAPRWEPRYILYPAGCWNLARVALAITVVHFPKGLIQRPTPARLLSQGMSYARQSLEWKHGVLPEALPWNLRLLTFGTLIFAAPEWRGAIGLLGQQGLVPAYTGIAMLVAVGDTAGGLALALRKNVARWVLAAAAALCILKMGWGLAGGYDHGIVSWVGATVVTPIEVWVIWFLLQPEVAGYLRRGTATLAVSPEEARAAAA